MNMLNLLKKISNRLNFIFYTHSSRYKLRYLYSYDRKSSSAMQDPFTMRRRNKNWPLSSWPTM